ncbi:hypothetical protein D9M68_465640 [compost metagenome]
MSTLAWLRSVATGSFGPTLLKKSAPEGTVLGRLKNRTTLVLLRKNQGSSAFCANQISTSITLFRGQEARRDFFNRIGRSLSFTCAIVWLMVSHDGE